MDTFFSSNHKSNSNDKPDIPRLAFSVGECANAHGVSRSFMYSIIDTDIGPATMKINGRRLVSAEEAAAWRHKMKGPSANKTDPSHN